MKSRRARRDGAASPLLLHVPGADPDRLHAAREFLVYRRRLAAQSDFPPDELLGIWVSRQPVEGGIAPGADRGSADLHVRESCSLAGVWTVCWLDGPALSRAPDAAARRHAVLDYLARCGAGPEEAAFVPIFPAGESGEAIGAALRHLRQAHPRLVDGRWSLDDSRLGIMSRAEATR